MLPLVSVIIPTYNREKTIKRSIDSVISQDYDNIEIIIVDDRSNDKTKEIIKNYEDKRIVYIYNDSKKHGAGVARNMGIREAKGEYIAYNDSDDEWMPGKLKSQYDFITSNNADITFCLMQHGKMLIPSGFSEKKCNLEYILRGNIPGPPSIFGKSSCFKETLFDEDMKAYEDNDWVIRLFEKYRVCFQKRVFVDIHSSAGSVSSDYEFNAEMLKYVMNKHKNLYDRFKKSRKATLNQIGYLKALTSDKVAINDYRTRKTVKSLFSVIVCRGYRYFSVVRMLRYR